MLGGLRVSRGDVVVERFVTQKAAHLIAFLALTGRTHPREQLIEMLWPDVDPAVSRLRLNQVLASLRRQLQQSAAQVDGLIVADRWTVGLNPRVYRTDVADFERLATADDRSLEKAADLYRGELLPGVYETWATGERSRLTAMHASALERLRHLYRQEGLLDEAVAVATKLVALDPLQEANHLGLIRLYGLQGRMSLALEQYQRMEEALAEIGETPTESARRVIERIRKGDVPKVDRRSLPSPPPLEIPQATNLPARLSRFFGRDEELKTVKDSLEGGVYRLITILGPGGVGKTQLALEVGYRAADAFPAIYFVPLANLSRPDELADAILAALRESPSRDQNGTNRVMAVLRRWDRLLLVLDNFEHIPEAASTVGDLLAQVPGLVVLATSRAPLGLQGERRLEIAPLDVPPHHASLDAMLRFPSTQLFLDRAREVRPDFALTSRNKDAIQSICAQLEGLPLALELAAGWASTMSPRQILEGLSSRFDFLKSRRRNVPARHGSLQAAIDYGFALLDERSQRLLLTFSVFQGGFTQEAATAVAPSDAISECLTELAERSMIKAESSDDGTSLRFSMLESLRDYALARLEEADAQDLRRRHAAYFAALAHAASQERYGPKQSEWLTRLTEDHPNLLRALEWLERDDPVTGLRMASALDWYWEAKGHLLIGQSILRRLLRDDSLPTDDKGDALNSLTWLTWNQNELDEAARVGEEARTIFAERGNRKGLQNAVYNLGVIAFRKRDSETACHFLGQALDLAKAEDDLPGISRALILFGNVARIEGDLPEAKAYYERSLPLEMRMENAMRTCFLLSNLGGLAEEARDFVQASGYYERCVAISRSTGHRSYEAVFLYNLGNAFTQHGRYDDAGAALDEALRIALDTRRDHLVFKIVWAIAALASRAGDTVSAATLWGIAANLSARTPLEPSDTGRLAESEADSVGESARASAGYAVARTLGGTMQPAKAIAFAFDWLSREI